MARHTVLKAKRSTPGQGAAPARQEDVAQAVSDGKPDGSQGGHSEPTGFHKEASHGPSSQGKTTRAEPGRGHQLAPKFKDDMGLNRLASVISTALGPFATVRSSNQYDPFWAGSGNDILIWLRGRFCLSVMFMNFRWNVSGSYLDTIRQPPDSISTSPWRNYLWNEVLRMKVGQDAEIFAQPAILLYNAKVSAAAAAELLTHLHRCLPEDYIVTGFTGTLQKYSRLYMKRHEPFISWVGEVIGTFWCTLPPSCMECFYCYCGMLLNREPKEGDVIFARACMADFAISALGTYLRKQEVLRRPKPHSIARILDSLIQDFGMASSFRAALDARQAKVPGHNKDHQSPFPASGNAIDTGQSSASSNPPAATSGEFASSTGATTAVQKSSDGPQTGSRSQASSNGVQSFQAAADVQENGVQQGQGRSQPSATDASSKTCADSKPEAASKKQTSKADAAVTAPRGDPRRDISKKERQAGAVDGLEEVLRSLLVQPFTEQAVKLMTHKRKSRLSGAEKEAAISQTVNETTAWAVTELRRLQAAKQASATPPPSRPIFKFGAGPEPAKAMASTPAVNDAGLSDVASAKNVKQPVQPVPSAQPCNLTAESAQPPSMVSKPCKEAGSEASTAPAGMKSGLPSPRRRQNNPARVKSDAGEGAADASGPTPGPAASDASDVSARQKDDAAACKVSAGQQLSKQPVGGAADNDQSMLSLGRMPDTLSAGGAHADDDRHKERQRASAKDSKPASDHDSSEDETSDDDHSEDAEGDEYEDEPDDVGRDISDMQWHVAGLVTQALNYCDSFALPIAVQLDQYCSNSTAFSAGTDEQQTSGLIAASPAASRKAQDDAGSQRGPTGRLLQGMFTGTRRAADLQDFLGSTKPDLREAQRVSDELQAKQMEFLGGTMREPHYSRMGMELGKAFKLPGQEAHANLLMGGEPGSVVRARMGNFSVSACLEELWKECLARESPIVAMYGNVALSRAYPPAALEITDEVAFGSANIMHRIMAVMVIVTCTSAWLRGKLPLAGNKPGKHWFRYAEEDANYFVLSFKLLLSTLGMLDSSIVEASSAEGSKALQEARACLDHMRPLVALLVHVSRPSQLRASSDPQQALQAIRNALLDIAATCNISTWTHARLLAVQVDGWCGKDLVEQAGWNLQYRPDSRAEWRRAVNKAAQEYCGPEAKAMKIQMWLQQADVLFSSAIPSAIWDNALWNPAYPGITKSVWDKTYPDWQAGLDQLLLELHVRRQSCCAWIQMYMGDETHNGTRRPDYVGMLVNVYERTVAAAEVLRSVMPSVLDEQPEPVGFLQNAADRLWSSSREIDMEEAKVLEVVKACVHKRNGKKNLRATTWAVTEPTDSPPGSPRAASSTSWAASSTPGTKSTFAFPKSQTSKSQQKPSSAPGKKPAQPKGTPQIILDRVLRVISMGPWRAPPDLMDNITRQLPEQPPRGNSARQAWHGEYAHKEMALGMLRGVLSTRRDTVTPCLRGLGLSETHQEESNTCAVKYDELLDKFALMQSQAHQIIHHGDLDSQAGIINEACAFFGTEMAELYKAEDRVHEQLSLGLGLESQHPGFLTKPPGDMCDWVDEISMMQPGLVPPEVAQAVRASHMGKAKQTSSHSTSSTPASKPSPVTASNPAAAGKERAAIPQQKAPSKGEPALASTAGSIQSAGKAKTAAVSGTNASSVLLGQAAASQKPSKQQEKASSGLAKGFLSRPSGLGGKGSGDSGHQVPLPSGNQKSKVANDHPAGEPLCTVWTTVPETWWINNHQLETHIVDSLENLRTRTNDFQEHYSRRSKSLKRSKQAPMRDSFIKSHVDGIFTRSSELEQIVYTLRKMEYERPGGAEAFERAQILHRDNMRLFTEPDDDKDIFSLMQGLQLPPDLCKEALEISFTLKDITCEVEDGLSEAANDLCAPEDIPMNSRAARPDSSSVTGSKSAAGQVPAKASSAAGISKLAEAWPQGVQQPKKKDSGGPASAMQPTGIVDGGTFVHGPHGTRRVDGRIPEVPAGLQDELNEVQKKFESSMSSIFYKGPPDSSKAEAKAPAKPAAQDDFSKQFAANLRRRMGGKKEELSESPPAVASLPLQTSSTDAADKEQASPVRSAPGKVAIQKPAAQTSLPSSSPADGETLYPEGMSKQERKRAKRKAQKLKAQEQEQEADDIEQDLADTTPASGQPTDEASSRRQAETQSSEGVKPAQAEGHAKGQSGSSSLKADAAEAHPAVSGFPDGDLASLSSRASETSASAAGVAAKGKKSRKVKAPVLPLPPSSEPAPSSQEEESAVRQLTLDQPSTRREKAHNAASKSAQGPGETAGVHSDDPRWTVSDVFEGGVQDQKLSRKQAKKAAAASSQLPAPTASSNAQHVQSKALRSDNAADTSASANQHWDHVLSDAMDAAAVDTNLSDDSAASDDTSVQVTGKATNAERLQGPAERKHDKFMDSLVGSQAVREAEPTQRTPLNEGPPLAHLQSRLSAGQQRNANRRHEAAAAPGPAPGLQDSSAAAAEAESAMFSEFRKQHGSKVVTVPRPRQGAVQRDTGREAEVAGPSGLDGQGRDHMLGTKHVPHHRQPGSRQEAAEEAAPASLNVQRREHLLAPKPPLHHQASRQVAAALSSGNSEEVRQALRGAVMALSSSLNPSDSKEVREQMLEARNWLQQHDTAGRRPASSAGSAPRQPPSQHQFRPPPQQLRPPAERGPPARNVPPAPKQHPSTYNQYELLAGSMLHEEAQASHQTQASQPLQGLQAPSGPGGFARVHSPVPARAGRDAGGSPSPMHQARAGQAPPEARGVNRYSLPDGQSSRAGSVLPSRSSLEALRSAEAPAGRAAGGPESAGSPTAASRGSPFGARSGQFGEAAGAAAGQQPAPSGGLPAWLLANLGRPPQPMSASMPGASAAPSAQFIPPLSSSNAPDGAGVPFAPRASQGQTASGANASAGMSMPFPPPASGPYLPSGSHANPFAAVGGRPGTGPRPQQMGMNPAAAPFPARMGGLQSPATVAASSHTGPPATSAANPFLAANPFHPSPAPVRAASPAMSQPKVEEKVPAEAVPEADFSEQTEDDVCIVCLDGPRNAYFGPCSCRVACYECALRVTAKSQTCPWCGQRITGAFKADYSK